MTSQCEDYSDQIFPENTKCDYFNYIDKYLELFCPTTLSNYDSVCAGLRTLRQTGRRLSAGDEYLDPHNCTGSCAEPGQKCTACTNSEYLFCKRNNVSVCMHPGLECDGHPQCDDAEDEDIDKCHSIFFVTLDI